MSEQTCANRATHIGLGVWLLSALLGMSVALNAFHLHKIRSVQERLRRCAAMPRERAQGGPLAVGTRAPSLHVRDLSGRSATLIVARPGKLTVAYTFSPGCVWCKRNVPNMMALMQAAGANYEFLPISLTQAGLQQFLTEAGLHGPAYVVPSPEAQHTYGFGATPQTIVIGSDGIIIKNWKGAYTGALLEEVSSTLGVQLPGLAERRRIEDARGR